MNKRGKEIWEHLSNMENLFLYEITDGDED